MVDPVSGVFELRNLKTDRCLIDSSLNVQARWNRHRMELKMGSHRNRLLQKDWVSYGEGNFEFTLISKLDVEKIEVHQHRQKLKELENKVVGDLQLGIKESY